MEPAHHAHHPGRRGPRSLDQLHRDGLKLPLRDGPQGVAFFETRGTGCRSIHARRSRTTRRSLPRALGFAGFAIAHNVRSPEEVEQILHEAVEAGAKLIKPGQKVFWGGYSGYFADPDGFLWEVAWNPHFWVE